MRVGRGRACGIVGILTAVLVVPIGCASRHYGTEQRVTVRSEPPGATTGADHAANFGLTLAAAVGIDLLTGAGLRAPATVRPTLRRRPVRRGPAREGIVLPDPRPGTDFEDAVPRRFWHAGER